MLKSVFKCGFPHRVITEELIEVDLRNYYVAVPFQMMACDFYKKLKLVPQPRPNFKTFFPEPVARLKVLLTEYNSSNNLNYSYSPLQGPFPQQIAVNVSAKIKTNFNNMNVTF